MKIGIYGDSYTTSHGFHDLPTNWYNKLATLLNDTRGVTTINHYGKGGSSLYYSYRNFFDTQHENDLNIVLITGPGRHPFTVEFDTPGNSRTFTSKAHVESTIVDMAHMLTSNDIVKLKNVIGWFDASTDERYFKDVAELMVDKISATPNTIIYPCFSDSLTHEQFKQQNLDKHMNFMHSLWFRQCELLDIDPNTFTAVEKPTLCGHLSREFNEFFAHLLFKKIHTGKWDHAGFLDVTIKDPRKFYYENYKDE